MKEHNMKKNILILVMLMGISLQAQASLVAPGASVFIAPMEGGLNSFLSAEIIKQKLPVQIVLDETKADYVITGSMVTAENKWQDVAAQIFIGGNRDRTQGSIMLINPKNKSLVWSGNAGDRSFWLGALARKGQRKLAIRLVKLMRKDVF